MKFIQPASLVLPLIVLVAAASACTALAALQEPFRSLGVGRRILQSNTSEPTGLSDQCESESQAINASFPDLQYALENLTVLMLSSFDPFANCIVDDNSTATVVLFSCSVDYSNVSTYQGLVDNCTAAGGRFLSTGEEPVVMGCSANDLAFNVNFKNVPFFCMSSNCTSKDAELVYEAIGAWADDVFGGGLEALEQLSQHEGGNSTIQCSPPDGGVSTWPGDSADSADSATTSSTGKVLLHAPLVAALFLPTATAFFA